METNGKILTVAGLLGIIGAVLAGLGVYMGVFETRAALVVAESGILASFFSGVIAAYSGPASKGIDAREQPDLVAESELLRLRNE